MTKSKAIRKTDFQEELYITLDRDPDDVYGITWEVLKAAPEGLIGIYKLVEVKKKVDSYELI